MALEPEILWKRWFAWVFCKHLFSYYTIFTWIWTYKTHDLTDHQLIVGSVLLTIASMGRGRSFLLNSNQGVQTQDLVGHAVGWTWQCCGKWPGPTYTVQNQIFQCTWTSLLHYLRACWEVLWLQWIPGHDLLLDLKNPVESYYIPSVDVIQARTVQQLAARWYTARRGNWGRCCCMLRIQSWPRRR